MKILLDVIKTLFLINGVIVLPSLFLLRPLYQQNLFPIAKTAQINNSSSEFHRDLEDTPPNYQQQIEETRQQLEKLRGEKDQQIQALEAQLKTVRDDKKAVTAVVDPSQSPNTFTVQSPRVSQPQVETKMSQPSARKSTPVKVTTVSQPIAPIKSKKSLDVPSSSSQTLVKQVPSSKDEVALMPSQRKDSSMFQREIGNIGSEELIFPNVLTKNEPKPQKTASQQIMAPQAKTPIKESITLANDLHVGLIVAHEKNQLNYGTKNYRKVQTAISSLRNGSSNNLDEAAQRSGIEASVLVQLAKWGQDRPGSFHPPYISYANSN